MFDHLQQTGALTCFIWKRDKVRLLIWVLGISLGTIVLGAVYPGLFSTIEEQLIMAETMENPAMIAMFGPVYGNHLGAIFANQLLLFTALIVAIMSVLLVTRYTRQDEEAGRIEMIRSLPVGKLANLCSTLIILTIAHILIGLITSIGLTALRIETMDLTGSLLYGAVLSITGIFFAASTAFFAQLAETSRGTLGYSFAFLGLVYLVRAAGDNGTEILSLISPLGLLLRTKVYVNNHWWPILVTLLLSVIVAYFALMLNSIRDLEAGFIPARPGRKHASRFLQSPLGLALRLEKTTIIGWAIGMFILGASYGSIFGDVEKFFETSDLYQQMLPAIPGYSLNEQFVAMLLLITAIIAAIPVLLTILKLGAEENANRTEHLLARSVSRTKLIASYLSVAFISSILMQILGVLGLWSASAAVMEEPFKLGRLIIGALAYLPPLWVFIGLSALLIAIAPRYTSLVWLYLGYSFFTLWIGNLLKLPEWVNKLTPFGHIPKVPLEKVSALTLIILTGIAVVLTFVGVRGYNERDIYG